MFYASVPDLNLTHASRISQVEEHVSCNICVISLLRGEKKNNNLKLFQVFFEGEDEDGSKDEGVERMK